MLEPRLISTSMSIASVIARDCAERDGSISQLTSCEVIGHPTGKVWGFNKPAGPLDGQAETVWWCEASYTDGSTQKWGPTTKRGN